MSPTPVPYLAPVGWYAAWLHALLRGCTEPEARRRADREWPCEAARRTIGSRQKAMKLSVPLAGGAKAASHRAPGTQTVSAHGRWTHVHTGAMNALWARSPFYDHLRPALDAAYADCTGQPLGSLCERLHEVQTHMLGLPGILDSLRHALREGTPAITRTISEATVGTDPDTPLLELLCARGPEAIFSLAATFSQSEKL